MPTATNNQTVHDRAIVFGLDLARDRGQLKELAGAVKQREYSEGQIFEAEKARALEVDKAIEELNQNEAKRAKPWYKKLF